MDHAERRRRQLHPWEIQKVGKDGTTLWGARDAKAIERSEGDVVLLIACENITSGFFFTSGAAARRSSILDSIRLISRNLAAKSRANR
jgi:hypothetical protein